MADENPKITRDDLEAGFHSSNEVQGQVDEAKPKLLPPPSGGTAAGRGLPHRKRVGATKSTIVEIGGSDVVAFPRPSSPETSGSHERASEVSLAVVVPGSWSSLFCDCEVVEQGHKRGEAPLRSVRHSGQASRS